MSLRHMTPLAVSLAAGVALSGVAYAAPPINASLHGGNDGQSQYTVRVDSKTFGDGQETRKIRSGETDDFTWKSVPPSGAVAMTDDCPGADSVPRDANGAMVREAQVRLAPSVDRKGVANVQMSFQASAPDGVRAVNVNGKTLQCPNPLSVSQIKWLTISTNGGAKTVAMSDGTRVTVSIKR